MPTPPAYSPLSLSPLMSSLGGQRCSPPSLVASVVFDLGHSFSVAEVLYLLFPPPATGVVSSCCASLVFLLLVLVHLRFFHSVSCGWLPFWGSPAGYSFPNGRLYGKRSSSSSRPGGRRSFIGVRGVGSFFRAFGSPEVGAVSFPDPFRRLSVPPLAGLEGQGCGDLGC